MPKTPRFVQYKNNGTEYVIHMYPPRFVAIVTGKDSVAMHDQWDDDNETEVKFAEVIKKMQEWIYFTRRKNNIQRQKTN